ncbi:MAG TPA: BBP7 family outer membrane beta-barrel protein [Gemmataceae bacterium]|nr:BBP7 family outer membrane beta-barrel protein [Gemmataceae bacterium]
MGKWRIGALAAIGWLGAWVAAHAQTVPFAGPGTPTADNIPVQMPLGMPASFTAPPPPPPPPDPPPMGPGGYRGFDNAFDEPCPTVPPPFFHTEVGYLGVWTKHNSAPILVTQGSIFDPIPGALAQPGTTPIIGGTIDGDTYHSGARLSFAYDCCCDRSWTVDANVFALQDRTETQNASNGGGGFTVLARPFFSVPANSQSAVLIADSGLTSGGVAVQLKQQVYGGDANVIWNFWPGEGGSWAASMLLGGRALSVDEQMFVTDTVQGLPTSTLSGVSVFQNDNISCHNYFYGAQPGVVYSWYLGSFSLDLIGKVAFGYTDEWLSMNGVTQTTFRGRTTTANGALLVLPSNAGTYHKDEFAVAPELLINAKYAFNQYFRVGVGYDYLYLSRLLRPGDQVDEEVGGAAPVHPTALLKQSDWWMEGFTASLEFSF